MVMLAQTVLPFKLEATEERLTANAGLVLFGEFARGLGVGQWIDGTLPAPGSGRGYAASRYVTPLVLMLTGGGRALEDLREIADDRGLSHLLTDVNVPSTDAVGDWLRRMGAGAGLHELGKVCDRVTGVVLRHGDRTDHTLDIDASQIVAEKQEAKWTYKGEVGYMPMVGHLAEAGIVLADEFREGNAAPGSNNLEFVRSCVQRMPRGHRIARLRADSASYQAALFNWCEAEGIEFAIGARHDEAAERAIAKIPADAWKQYTDCAIAETVHSMNETKKAFRMIVVKRQTQGELFDELKIRCWRRPKTDPVIEDMPIQN